jgi:hypothetical protein
MTTINITSPFGTTVVEVVKNKFTDKYIPQIKSMFADYPSKSWLITYGGIMLRSPTGHVDRQIQRLNDAIAELNEMGTKFPYEFNPDVLKLCNTDTQLYLNDLHRAFTTAHKTFFEGHCVWSDKFESTVDVSCIDTDRFLYLIDQINDAVHAMELYVKTERNSSVTSGLAQQVEVGADTYVNNGSRLIKECFFYIDKEDYEYFSDSDEYDVWVGTSILGKDYVIAYYQHDRAGEWDITHMLGYSCKFTVDVSEMKRADIIKSKEFQQWLAEGGVEYTPAICGMPIGRVISGKEFLNSYMRKVTYNDKLVISIDE